MKWNKLIFATFLAGAVLIPALNAGAANRSWDNIEAWKTLTTPNVKSKKSNLEFYLDKAKTLEADLAADGFNIITGDSYQINNTSVLNATTLGSGVTASSLTSHGNQTRKHFYTPNSVQVDLSNPPLATVTAGGTGNQWDVHRFAGSGAVDHHVAIPWHVPDGYVTDSGRLNIMWSCESAETGGDQVTFDLAMLAVGSSESVDSTATAFSASGDTQWGGVADTRFTSQLNFEVADIAVDDLVYIDFFVDASLSSFTDTIDVHGYEVEWESTE